jgi:dTDP-4-dehydrorhamnose reductase
MRILLTGATGQVGGALLAPLQSLGTVAAPDLNVFDLARPQDIPTALDRMAPDLIVNPAAYTAVDRAEDERELAFRINAEAPGVIARWAARRGAPLVHFSTDYVFDGSGTRPRREDDPTAPLSTYGASKLAGEDAVRAAGAPHLIVRTSWVYDATGANFLRTIARLAQERTELRIVGDQIGAPTSAKLIADTVAAIVKAPGAPLADRFGATGGRVNVVASGATSWHGFAVAIVEGLRVRGVRLAVEHVLPIATSDYPTRAKRPANSRLDMTRLREIFAIEPPNWEAMLAIELDRLAGELITSH